MNIKYSLIVVNYECSSYILKMIASLDLCVDERKDYEVIIVDNSSQHSDFMDVIDGSTVRYINSEGNVGFGTACNIGVKNALGDILLFVNPDIVFLRDILSTLDSHLDYLNDGNVLGFNFVDELGHPAYTHGCFPSLKGELFELFFLHKILPKYFNDYATAKIQPPSENGLSLEVDYVCGGLFCTSKTIYEQMNGFDETFFLYFEETELMWRFKKNGKKITLLLQSLAIHIGSVTTSNNSNFKIINMEIGRARFYKLTQKNIMVIITFFFVRAARLLSLAIVKNNITYVKAIKKIYEVLFGS